MTETLTSRRLQMREDAILDVAARHLNTVGVSAEWFGEIAAELGITRPALYTYFADREDLLFRCYLQTCDRLDRRLDAAEAHQDVVSILSAFVAGQDGDTRESAVVHEVAALPSEQGEIIWGRRDALLNRLSKLVKRGIEAGALRPCEPWIVANAILSMASWAPLYSRWGAGADLALIAEGSHALLFGGLAAERQDFDSVPGRLAPLTGPKLDIFNQAAIDAARRERILVAASALFNTRGIGATRVEDVGAAIGLSKRTIYHHMGQKQGLVEACVRRSHAYALQVMDAAERLQAPRVTAMSAAVRDVILGGADPEVTMLTPFAGLGLLDPAARQEISNSAQLLTAGYRRILEHGIAEGSIRPVRVDAVLASLPGIFTWVSKAPERIGQSSERIAEELATLVTLGVLADRKT